MQFMKIAIIETAVPLWSLITDMLIVIIMSMNLIPTITMEGIITNTNMFTNTRLNIIATITIIINMGMPMTTAIIMFIGPMVI